MRRNLQLNPFKKKSNAKPNKAHKLFILLPFISLLGLTLPSCGKNDNPSNPSGTKAAETSNPATPQSNIPPSQASAQDRKSVV